MYIYSFEKLEVWIEAKDFTKKLYKTSSYPDSEKFGLTSQMRRASVSVCSNIAEGSTRNGIKEKAYFLTMAYGSAIEILNQVIICFELEYISQEIYQELRRCLESISNKINSLRKFHLSQIQQ